MKKLPFLALAVMMAAGTQSAAQDRYDWNGAIPAGATLRVATGGGNVNVTRAQGSTARVRGQVRRPNGGDEEIRFELRRDGQDVTICALGEDADCTPQGIRNENNRGRRRAVADFTVELPAGVVIGASSGNGDVAVSGATAAVRAASGNGSVRVDEGATEVSASSGNGSVRVQGARSAVNASSGNGRIDVSTAAGPVTASSGNGDIRVSMASLRSEGDLTFSSGNGSVTVVLPENFGAELDATTGSGSIESAFAVTTVGRIGSGRLRGTIGGGGRKLRISTGNGRIALQRQGSSALVR
ncbi:MAG TPA: DUF4097 family beta strand repeat-containing protein [Longimicrobium sp.]